MLETIKSAKYDVKAEEACIFFPDQIIVIALADGTEWSGVEEN